MKRLFKVRLLPILLLLTLLCQAFPVAAQGIELHSTGMFYAAESKTYGTVAPGSPGISHRYYDQLETEIHRALYERFCEVDPYEEIRIDVSALLLPTVEGMGATQEAYDRLVAGLESIVFPAYAAVSLDNPLLFWASGVSYGMEYGTMGNEFVIVNLICYPDPTGYFDADSYEDTLEILEDLYESLEIPQDGTVYDKLKFFHDYLCNTVVYTESAHSHNVIGPLLYGQSVCEGYAKSFKLYCDMLEIPCIIVTGTGNTGVGSEAHAWNAVQMEDGNWYGVDVTWDDQTSGIYYDFFLVGGDSVPTYFNRISFNESHVPKGDFYGDGTVFLETPALHPADYDPNNVHIHEYEQTGTTEPTCVDPGCLIFTCTLCGATYTQVWKDALWHDLHYDFKTPTCTEDGYTIYTCSRCDYTYESDRITALGHVFSDWYPIREASCDADGEERRYCLLCGFTESIFSPMTGHQYETTVTLPSCEEDGYTTYVCVSCGGSYVDDIVPALGHNYQATVTPPTCEEDGFTTYTCENCGDSYVADETPATGHTFDEGVITVEPTEETEGTKLYTCTLCGETKTETLPTLEHTHKYEGVVTEPTCTEDGFTTYTCAACGGSYVADETPALGHDYQATVTEPTCEENGYTTYTCAACGDSYVSDEVPAAGHSWEDTGIIPPGSTGNGWTTYVCTACGKAKTVKKEPVYDIDGNGAVTTTDAENLLSLLVGNSTAETMPDLDFDGKFTIFDCVLLMQQLDKPAD